MLFFSLQACNGRYCKILTVDLLWYINFKDFLWHVGLVFIHMMQRNRVPWFHMCPPQQVIQLTCADVKVTYDVFMLWLQQNSYTNENEQKVFIKGNINFILALLDCYQSWHSLFFLIPHDIFIIWNAFTFNRLQMQGLPLNMRYFELVAAQNN